MAELYNVKTITNEETENGQFEMHVRLTTMTTKPAAATVAIAATVLL